MTLEATISDTQFISTVLASKYYQLASTLILLYDYIITLDLEIENIWTHPKISPGNILFVLNRYFPLISYFGIILIINLPGLRLCWTFSYFPFIMTTISDGIISAIVILRLYAVYLGALWVPIFLGALALINLGLGIHAATSITLVPPNLGVNGCILSVKENSYQIFALLWGMSVIFDTTIFVMTLWKTRQRCTALRMAGDSTCLPNLLLRDGTVYYAVMFSAKVINFAVFWIVSDTKDLITINWTFNHTITVIMISRLILNLRSEGERSGLPRRGREKAPTPFAIT